MTAWLVPALPAAGAVLVALGRRRSAGVVAVAATVATAAVALGGAAAGWTGGWRWGSGLELTLAVEGLGRVMAVLVPAVAAPIVAYAAASLRDDPGRRRLLAMLVAFVGAMELVVVAADLLTLLVGWELVALCSWVLIAHWWRDPERPRAATQAFVTTLFGALGLYLAAGASLAATGSVRFDALAGADGAHLHLVAAGVLVAAAAKSAQLPFSPWLFAAMAGPTPVSALLHSAAMVAAGAYALARLAPALSATGWFLDAVLVLGLAGALAGGVVASVQQDFKRALAASTTANYGLVLVAVGAAATAAAAAHLVAHAAFKSLLFLGAGVAMHAAGRDDLRGLRLGRALPVPALLFGVGVLALAAVPPLGAALSKEAIVSAAAHRGGWLSAAVLAAGFLSALYGARLLVLAFGRGDRLSAPRPPFTETAAMAVLAGASVALGVLWIPAVRAAFGGVLGARFPAASAWELAVGIASVGVAFGLVRWLDRRRSLVSLATPARVRDPVAQWLALPQAGRRLIVDPVLSLAAALARFDDRVIDAGIRAVARLSDAVSRLAAWWGERAVDGLVHGIALGTFDGARRSRRIDERVVDGAVEGLAGGVGVAGHRLRALQSGLAHRYYVIAALGVVAAVIVAAVVR